MSRVNTACAPHSRAERRPSSGWGQHQHRHSGPFARHAPRGRTAAGEDDDARQRDGIGNGGAGLGDGVGGGLVGVDFGQVHARR
jgi:hypothetical protein